MASSTLTMQSHNRYTEGNLEELSAAEALLTVSPPSNAVHGSVRQTAATFAGLESLAEQANALQSVGTRPLHTSVQVKTEESTMCTSNSTMLCGGLDALATLATEARSQTEATTASTSASKAQYDNVLNPHLVASGITTASPTSSSDDDSDAMPPPVSRNRRRSASNPEGMEKWDSLNRDGSSRRHFVLPASILEEELAEASAAIQLQKRLQHERIMSNKFPRIPEEPCSCDNDMCGVSPDSVLQQPAVVVSGESTIDEQPTSDDIEDEVDESELSPDELLRRARSRLLEDLSEGNVNGEKGVLTLPHSLAKYKEVRTSFTMQNNDSCSVMFISHHSPPLSADIVLLDLPLCSVSSCVGLQPEWPHRDLHAFRARGHYCSI